MLAIEMSDARGVDYHAIHAAGCRDLRDGQPIPGEPTTVLAVADSVCEATGYGEDEYDEDSVSLKPCAEHAMRKAAKAAAAVVVDPVANVEPDESTDVELPDVEPVTMEDRTLSALRVALADKDDAMTRAAAAEARVASLQAANRRLNETIQHMTTRIEADEIRFRVAERSEVKIQDGQTWVSNEHDSDHQVAGPGDEPGTWAMWGPVGNLHVISEAGLRSRYTLDPNR